MRILIINGSPKDQRSNTYRLTAAFLEGMGEGERRECAVSRMEIKPCLGCFSCWNKTPGKCVLQDDMAGVIENMLWADVIVWSFPLYYFSIPGGLKNLMDRQLPMVLPFMTTGSESGGHPSRYDMSRKRHVVISTCGFYTAKGNYDGVTAVFDHMCGKGNYEAIFCGQGELFRVKELNGRTEEYLSYVRRAGAEFVSGGISQETHQELEALLFPREVFEAMADASWGVEKNGEPSDETLVFTKQMAALYNKNAYPGKNLILEMYYTDEQKRYQIVLGKDGSTVLTENFLQPTTVIETSYTLWKAIAAGEISGEAALAQQKYRVKGDFSLMIHWDDYFGSQTKIQKASTNQKPTSMALLLLPWIVFWSVGVMNGLTGALLTMAACTAVPVLFFRNQKTIYDSLSGLFSAVCAMVLVLTEQQNVALGLSHLLFGLMWTVSCFCRIPLTAHYSMNNYGGDSAMRNPLFIKTNRILTACWGILYLASSVWTCFLTGPYIGLANSVLPMLLGVFTVWFQKWYPAKVARG